MKKSLKQNNTMKISGPKVTRCYGTSAADFLLSHGFTDAAAHELRRTLAMVGPLEPPVGRTRESRSERLA